MNSGDLIDKYKNEQSVCEPAATNNSQSKSTKKQDFNHYAPNGFKEFMGYEEPDYLRVAGLYASVERGRLNKIYGGFLVRRADYVAGALRWYTEDGTPDVKRAERAIRTACRKKAPNGLCYMYSMSNKDHCLSDKGGSRLYVSGRRYQELVDETIYLKNKYSENSCKMKISELVSPQITQDHQRIQYMLQEIAERHKLPIFKEGAIHWMADQFIQELDMKSFERYCDLITSDWYYDQAVNDRYCPKIMDVFDIYHKYENIVAYAERHQK